MMNPDMMRMATEMMSKMTPEQVGADSGCLLETQEVAGCCEQWRTGSWGSMRPPAFFPLKCFKSV